MAKVGKIAGVILVLAGLLAFVFAGKFNSSAEGYRSEARTAPSDQAPLYNKWAEENEAKGLSCTLGGLVALVAGGVLFFQPRLLNLLRDKTAPVQGTIAPTPISTARLGTLLLIGGALLSGLCMGMKAKTPSHYVFELSLGGPVALILALLVLLAFAAGFPPGQSGSAPRIRTIGIAVIAGFLLLNLLLMLLTSPPWYGPEEERPESGLAYGFFAQVLATAMIVAGAVIRVQADRKGSSSTPQMSPGTAG